MRRGCSRGCRDRALRRVSSRRLRREWRARRRAFGRQDPRSRAREDIKGSGAGKRWWEVNCEGFSVAFGWYQRHGWAVETEHMPMKCMNCIICESVRNSHLINSLKAAKNIGVSMASQFELARCGKYSHATHEARPLERVTPLGPCPPIAPAQTPTSSSTSTSSQLPSAPSSPAASPGHAPSSPAGCT